MNWDQIEGNWKQFTGKVKEKWFIRRKCVPPVER